MGIGLTMLKFPIEGAHRLQTDAFRLGEGETRSYALSFFENTKVSSASKTLKWSYKGYKEEEQENLTCEEPHPPGTGAEDGSERIKSQQECIIKNGERISEIFTNRDVSCKVEDQNNHTCKEPHPPAKRAECVPESIETLQQECCI
ncbi:hypothetical protein TNCT_198851 [Trichonephila clavata]|uniref:Uncharacterized protein n=1 Tax=Trichonephila clavata TaxID=2740835 RepID=A0A8X6GPY3_TRICU|nr:hypothetical protein TNCT_198851 [Trichonephila clavata]